MTAKSSAAVLQALAVVCELTQTELSDAAKRVLASDLAGYPERQVLGALTRCRKELKPRQFSLEAVLSRLDDGRPGPEEAWALAAKTINDECVSVVWTDEIAIAWGVARELGNDMVAARMAFLEKYKQIVQVGRDSGLPVKWVPCLGFDPHGRETALLEAARLGRLTQSHVAGMLPYRDAPAGNVLSLIEGKKEAA